MAFALLAPSATRTLEAQQPLPAAARPSGGRQLTAADLADWKTVRTPTLSRDGRWFAYVLAPNEGDAVVVLRPTAEGGKELRFPIGELPAPQPGGPGAPTAASLAISGDARFAAFLVHSSRADAKKARAQRRPVVTKVALVNLATGEKREFDRARRFAFAGDHPGWIAVHGYPAEAPSAAPAGGGAGAAPAPARSDAADLLLVNLATGDAVNVGNVAEFGFDKSGGYLAYTIDAREQIGNGVQLRTMATDVVRPLDSDAALYRRLAWADSGLALAVLRGKADTTAKDTLFSVVTFTNLAAARPTKTVLDPRSQADFPAGMKIAADRAPRLSERFDAVFFGIREARKPAPRQPALAEGGAATRSPVVQTGAPGAGGTLNQPRVDPDDENASLVLWHWKDPRLQSQQIVQEQQDRSFSFLAEYRFADRKVLRLADDSVRTVTVLPHERYAIGVDVRAYEQRASFSGRRYQDVYAIDLATGARTRALTKSPSPTTLPSPDGRQVLYWGEDGHWWVLDAASGAKRNVSRDASVSFVDVEDDHNNLHPPLINPLVRGLGWSRDGSAVLVSDGWDVWKLPVTGTGQGAVNLTADGKRTRVRYQRRLQLDPEEKGIDLAKPLYFTTYGDRTKREGLARVQPGRAGAVSLVSGDASYAFVRARDADVWLYTRQTFVDFPDWYVATPDFSAGRRITEANPQQTQFAWSSGARLVDYVSEKGDTLQAALFLPAGYEPGKRYPTVVTFYEKMSQTLHQHRVPNATSAPNPTLYTSRGYAVLMPDITFKVNDPGMSSLWSMRPAVRAAVATGIVDSANVGIQGHSWSGYQTAFLVTQTNMFKAAIAGAPLTDMVSMYSSIYWNTGGTNQAIFESSQGRFKGNFIENYDAYIRNSPAFHADKVQTPLVILHNDKDGAVDFNQGITYFNTLRQLGKDVILLEYVGENHGLQRPVNQKDYAARMAEYFDHHLRGAPAPDWMKNGVPRLQMEEHLKERRDADRPKPALVP